MSEVLDEPLVVVGSANIDLVVRVDRHPRLGETVIGGDHQQVTGGKGANQAVAAARLGSAVGFVGRVGADDYGARLRDALVAEGVDVGQLIVDETAPSGLAMITVGPDGDNTIVVSPGANGRVDTDDVERAVQAAAGSIVLAQLEIPLAAVEAAALAATGPFVLNPAPAAALPAGLLERVDVLVSNRGELATLANEAEATDLDAVASQAEDLHGPDATVVTLGSDGALVVTGGEATHVPAPQVDAVDATAAGDAFCGALAVRLTRGDDLVAVARYAVAAGSLAATRIGAQPSLPEAAAVEEMLA